MLSEPQPLWRCRQSVDMHRTACGVPAPGWSRPVPAAHAGPSLLASPLLGHKGNAHPGAGSGPGDVGVGLGWLLGPWLGVCQDGSVDQPEAGDQRMKMFLKVTLGQGPGASGS